MNISKKLEEIYLIEENSFIKDLYNKDMELFNEIIQESLVTKVKIDTLVKYTKKNLKNIENSLIDYGVDIKRIKRKSLNLATSLRSDLKKREDPDKIEKKIIKEGREIIKDEIILFKKNFDDKSLIEKILLSVVILILIIFLSYLGFSILSFFFGEFAAFIVFSIAIAPMIEEFGKRLAIHGKYPWLYTGIFSGLEMLGYVIGFMKMGGNILPYIILRLIAVLMHFSTTYVQKYFMDKKEQDINYTDMGYFLAILIHSSWNLLALIFNEELIAIVS